MYKIGVDKSKNRLYITIGGILSVEEAQKVKKSIEDSIPTLNKGFDVINDISKFIRGDDAAGIILKEIIILLLKSGVNNVVRVVGTSKTGLIQFATHTLPVDQYKISYVPSLEEAEKILSEK